ncbi:MAG: YraN family protein [Comamonadaceae bacterium]|nr:YraN family protein [Pseudomonadota bacterium]MBS0607814.1 YraN family protein [Pseudomonadota bacterium]MDE2414149.1 YraN family protein [Comamonadaceae bacterium]
MGFLGKKVNGDAQGRSTRSLGQAGEEQALAHLVAAGLTLVERNYRTPGRGGGEIDLVMRERDGTLVFVEVRSRGASGFGGAAASIGATKRRRIVLAARHYLLRWPAPPPCRFDAVLIEGGQVQWLRAAFDAT